MTSKARFVRADRFQTRWDFIDLEALLPSDHRARVVWEFVETLDLSAFYDAIKAREGEPGRPPPDPAVLLALWLYATIEGVGSARQLARLAQGDVAYRWIAGGVPLNYHGLADFRVAHMELLDRLLSESVTALIAEGLVSLTEIAVDGTKVRANASRESFKTGSKLERTGAAGDERLAALKAEIESDPEASARRKRSAQKRAARDVKERAAPEKLLVDTHYATSQDIAALAEHAAGTVKVFAPTPTERNDVKPATLAKRAKQRAREPESVKEWRSRMETPAGREVYGLRKLIERINANLKNHGFGFLYVRGLIKVKAVALWHALANNLMAAHRLRSKAA